MLKPKNRLKKTRDFNLLIKHGNFVNSPNLTLKYLKLDNLKEEELPKLVKLGTEKQFNNFKNQLRLAFSVGLKIHKSAVKRNRLKRQLREAVRLMIKEDKLKSGYYILLIPKKSLLEADFTKISQDLELLFKKGKILVTSNQ